jgi:hypothetical protein
LKQDLSGEPFFVLPYRKFWEHVTAHYGNLWGYSMALIPMRMSLLIPAYTSCNERGIAEYNRIHTASRTNLEVSKVRDLFAIKNYGTKPSQVNILPKAKSKTRSKQNKDMHKCSSVYSKRGVPLPVLTSGGE